tara:strand:- start:211 stop:579 length:369 start_codon:yes stop_codon:yes gene_type:complete
MSFKVNPLTDDIVILKNEAAIARSIRNLVLTEPGERFFEPDLGSNVQRSLFELLDDISASQIKDEIENAINNFEPRVQLLPDNGIEVTPDYDNNQFNVTVRYNIVGVNAQTQQLSFALEPTR